MSRFINVFAALAHVEIASQKEAIECRDEMSETGWSWGNGELVSPLEREAIEAMAEGYVSFYINTPDMIEEADANGL